MMFPLWKFWTYSPLGFGAAIIWNISELLRLPLPGNATPHLFGLIMGVKPVLVSPKPLPTQDTVSQELDNALEGGYDHTTDNPLYVAESLANYSSECDHVDDYTLLVPMVVAWQQSKLN